MTSFTNVPATGEIQISALFRIHGQCSPRTYVQNASREVLRKQVPAVGRKVGLEINDYLFAILRHKETGKPKSIGVVYSFLFRGMDLEKLTAFNTKLQQHFERPGSARRNMWSDWAAVISVQNPAETHFVPSAGEIMIRAFFGGETGESAQETSRSLLLSEVPQIASSMGLSIKPLMFGVVRHVETTTKPVGIVCRFTFKNMDLDRYGLLEDEMRSVFGRYAAPSEALWSKYEFLLFRDLRT